MMVLLPLLRFPACEQMVYCFLWLALVSLLPSNHEDAQHVWALLVMLTTRSTFVLLFQVWLGCCLDRQGTLVGYGLGRLLTVG